MFFDGSKMSPRPSSESSLGCLGSSGGGLGPLWGGLGVELGGVLWGVVWSWVVLGEVLGGFGRPDRFPGCTTVEGQGLPRGVRGARLDGSP